jgi:colicin import membrane protein
MTAAASIFEERADPGRVLSAVLAGGMHALLFVLLVFGVRWQSRPPEAVQVELWYPPAVAQPVEEPKPVPKVEPPPPSVAQPEAAKPEPPLPKPEIVEKKAPPPKPVPKAEPKPLPKPVTKAELKPVPKAEPLKPRVNDATKRMHAELAREQASLAVDHERQMLKDLAAREASSASSKAQAAWVDKVRAKIRGNIVLPSEIKGNPEAIFSVAQLPNGDVLTVKLKKSSGMPALDGAIERAVLKSSPLPKPDGGFTAPREFELKYKPLE